MTRRAKRTPAGKRRSARIGALVFILAAAIALPASIATGSCAQETRSRRALVSLPGGAGHARQRPSLCGIARMIGPDPVDAVPCQVWNLLPLTGIGAIAAVWLVLDLLGLDRRRRD